MASPPGGWIFFRSSIESSSRLFSDGLAGFKKAAPSKRKRACDRDESDNAFHQLTIEGLRQFLQPKRGRFLHRDESDLLELLDN